jgi:hypothetical protein
MKCDIMEKYLKENACSNDFVPAEIKKHLSGCKNCQTYYQFALLLNSQKSLLEKAPEDILPNVEMKILDSLKQSKSNKPFSILKPRFIHPLKPALAGFCVLLVAVLSYTCLANKNIGYVENLSERFKIAQFENIKSGDELYTGDSTTAAISLESKNELQIHHNTMVRVKGSRHITLSRGEISLLSGDKELQIETPDGVLLARNTDTKITTTARQEDGVLRTETTCIVFNGKVTIKYQSKEIVLNQGQKVVLAENGGIAYQKDLTAAETESEKGTAVKQKIYAAVQSLCDCIYASEYTPGKKADHLQLFGKEANENKFKVRVFWQEKGLNEQGFGPLNGNNQICSAKTGRIHA